MIHFTSRKYELNTYNTQNSESDIIYSKYGSSLSSGISTDIYYHGNSVLDSFTTPRYVQRISKDEQDQMEVEKQSKVDVLELNHLEQLLPLATNDILDIKSNYFSINKKLEIYIPQCESWPIDAQCSSSTCTNYLLRTSTNIHAKQLISGCSSIKPAIHYNPGTLYKDSSTILPCLPTKQGFGEIVSQSSHELFSFASNGYSNIRVPDFKRLINDCGKMQVLHRLLPRLFAEKHR